MLTKENCKGVWCGIDIPWNADMSFNDKRFAHDCEKMCEAGVPGIYTTGSSGEWHVLDFQEFKYLVDVFADVMKGKKALSAVGCHDLNTRDAMKKMDYVAGKGSIDGIQFAFPSWLKMSGSECNDYIVEICTAYPQMGFWHYNTERSKVKFSGRDYLNVIDKCSNLIATKWTDSDIFAYSDLAFFAGELNHFVGEHFLLYGMMNGAAGSCSSLVSGNPELMLKLYELCEKKEWVRANELQKKINEWFVKVVIPLVRKGHLDSAMDKAIAYVGNYNPPENVLTRKPYGALTAEELKFFREETERVFPEFIYNGV